MTKLQYIAYFLSGGMLLAEDLFAFKIIEDTYHGTPTHNVDNCFNNAHNSCYLGSESQRLLLLR